MNTVGNSTYQATNEKKDKSFKMFKLFVLSCILSVVSAAPGAVVHSAPVVHATPVVAHPVAVAHHSVDLSHSSSHVVHHSAPVAKIDATPEHVAHLVETQHVVSAPVVKTSHSSSVVHQTPSCHCCIHH